MKLLFSTFASPSSLASAPTLTAFTLSSIPSGEMIIQAITRKYSTGRASLFEPRIEQHITARDSKYQNQNE